MAFIPGIQRLGTTAYSDARRAGHAREPALDHQPELQWYMDRYRTWRQLYNGSALEETVSGSSDPSTAEENYRWPVRFNLVNAYCQLHAGMLWGRGRTGADSNDLFTVRIDPRVPYGPKPATDLAPRIEDLLNYFWARQIHILRSVGVIQQWAGGAIVKVSWNPGSRNSVFGVVLETIQPEYFFPIWNPLNFEELYAVKIKFTVSKAVAIARYNITERDLERFGNQEQIPVEEYWDAGQFHIIVGKRDAEDQKGVVAKGLDGKPLQGKNPWKHPVTGNGIIPIHYIPRIRAGTFMGESLAYKLEGLQQELNKTLADYGDALTRGAHPAFGLSDYNGPGKKDQIIPIPRHGALNLGNTAPGSNASPKVHEFPLPAVPPQTTEFVERLLSLSEAVAGLTPAARGLNQGRESGLALALQMLPTINLVDWSRAHLGQAITGQAGINDTMLTIWWNKRSLDFVPSLGESPVVFRLPQEIEFRPVVPRDRIEIIDEVTRLATAEVVSPIELLHRLGDIEDIDEELLNIQSYLQFKAAMEAAIAGRSVKISKPKEQENPARAWPTITGETVQQAPKQPPKQPQGLKPNDPGTS